MSNGKYTERSAFSWKGVHRDHPWDEVETRENTEKSETTIIKT
jgi:hypothetical protein